jgi:hypothetical protein
MIAKKSSKFFQSLSTNIRNIEIITLKIRNIFNVHLNSEENKCIKQTLSKII